LAQAPDTLWKRYGIQDESCFLALYHNRVANKIIAHFERDVPATSTIRSIYVKTPHDAIYHRLTPCSDQISYDSLVSLASQPVVLVNVLRWHDSCGEWDHLAVVDLLAEHLYPVVVPTDLRMSPQYSRSWISQLVSADPAGQHVECVIAMHRAIDSIVEYWLCELYWTTKRVVRLAELPATFF